MKTHSIPKWLFFRKPKNPSSSPPQAGLIHLKNRDRRAFSRCGRPFMPVLFSVFRSFFSWQKHFSAWRKGFYGQRPKAKTHQAEFLKRRKHNKKKRDGQNKDFKNESKAGHSDFFPFKLLSFKGYSLIELLTVVAILGILSTVSYSAYIRQKNTSHNSWMKNELAEINKFLEMAYSADGFYHQYLGATGYKPGGSLLGNAGFKSGYHSQPPCCPNYPNPHTEPKKDFDKYSFIKKSGAGLISHHSNAQEICTAYNSKKICKSGPAISLSQNLSHLGVSGQGNCDYNLKKVECACHEFTIVAATSYGKGARTAPKATDGDGIMIMDHNGIICKAKPDASGHLKPH